MGDGEKSPTMSKNVFDLSCKATMEDLCEMFHKKCKIASEEGETSSAMVPKRRKIASEEGETSSAIFPKRRKVSSEAGETSSAMSKNVYEVFLSFRGPDTRQGFTDCLYHAMVDAGITVFRDDDELRLGDKLVEILTAIDNSKLCVVVFSPTFAVSSWCLREVERMIGMKKEIVPIFVGVTPDDVKLKTPLYDDALTEHETKYGKERVQQWRDALKAIPKIKGRELKNSGFAEFSKQLVKQILTKLKLRNKFEILELVEVPDEVEEALELLNIESDDERRFLGIHGMGGIGKTTLAKIVFNQICDSFDCSCFLENVRDNLSQEGQVGLQGKLLISLNPSSTDLKKNFTNKKVLIVLDDIDEKSQIHSLVGDSGWFGLGSRIIFTTRKARLHEQLSSSNATFHGLEKKEMKSKQALELFSKHAFGQDFPPEDFKDLSNKIISVTSRLPLALEVVGSFLCRKKAKVWISTIKKLKEAPDQDVQRKLRLSYDALEPEQQEIFLDIACFFIGQDKKKAVYMWEACDFYPDHGIEVLISMSLIKITSRTSTDDKWKLFWMHDQLRDLGRAIVNEKYKDPRAGSRLWVAGDALDQLKGNLEKEKVEAIQLHGDFTTLDREDFVSLKKLRFLDMESTDVTWRFPRFSGEFDGLLPKLRWLSLAFASFDATNLCHKELAVLELFRCSLDWHDSSQFLMLENLKVLTISECNKVLPRMPDLSKLVNLERLVFYMGDKMTYIHASVWKLQCLKHLTIYGVANNLSNNPLPESIGHLVCLTTLSLRFMGFTKLPNNIGKLVKLKRLWICDCIALKKIPESIGDLRSLVSLNLSNTSIRQVPTTIGRLTKLESLNLSRCRSLHSLPNSIGKLQWLIDLDLASSGIEQLPNSLGDLASLKKLDLRETRVTSLPVSIRNLERLEVLNAAIVNEVPELPTGLITLTIYSAQKIQRLSNLINLSHLEIDNTSICSRQILPASMGIEVIEKLSKLKHLMLKHLAIKSLPMDLSASQQLKSLTLICPNLEFGQCQLPSSLVSLYLKVKDWGELSLNLPSLKNLSELVLDHFQAYKVDGIEQETGYARFVSMDLSALQKLRSLTLRCFKLEFGQCQLPSSLESLDIKLYWREQPLYITKADLTHLGANEIRVTEKEAGYVKSLSMDFSALQKLKSLKLCCPKLEELEQCQLPSSLASLNLEVKDCAKSVSMDFSALLKLMSLTLCCLKLEFRQCQLPSSLESLDLHVKQYWGQLPINLSSLKNLSKLTLMGFSMEGFDEIEGLESLKELRLFSCDFPSKCLDLSLLDRLQDLSISKAAGLVKISGILKVEYLWISQCKSFQRIEDISKLNELRLIYVRKCCNFLGIDGIDRVVLPALTRIDIIECKCEDVVRRY